MNRPLLVKIWLVHNERSGDGLDEGELRRTIEAAGHTIATIAPPAAAADGLKAEVADLVVVAGGDGTVRRVATAVAGHGVPLAVLSTGTANNIASSLGVATQPERAIAEWSAARPVPIDLGLVRGAVDGRVIESIGGGLIADGIAAMDREFHPESEADAMLAKAVVRFRHVLAELAPRRCLLTIDGVATVGDYLLIEVMNIASVGPNVALAPAADPTDGTFDVVTATEAERGRLVRYLEERIAGRPGALALPTRKARTVELSGFDRVHLDDRTYEGVGGAAITARVEPGAIQVLVPAGELPRRAGRSRAASA